MADVLAAAAVAVGKGERTRTRLLEIAVRRFAADGYRRTSVSDIAREAGLTPAAAYAYFAGKEALFKAAVDADAAALIDKARAALPDAPIIERFGVLVATLVERLDEHPLARRVLAGQEPEVLGRLLDIPSLKEIVADNAEQLAAAQETGEVRADVDPVLLSEGLESIVLALLMAYLQAGVDPDSRRAIAAFSVLDTALRPPEPTA
ncbi:MAG: TetR/AcrR family transcriptional regulator [Actinomycetota bacterium]